MIFQCCYKDCDWKFYNKWTDDRYVATWGPVWLYVHSERQLESWKRVAKTRMPCTSISSIRSRWPLERFVEGSILSRQHLIIGY